MTDIDKARVAILASDGHEKSERFEPKRRIETAGATHSDEAPTTSRNPGNLDAFCPKVIGEIEEGRHERSIA